MQLSGSRSWIKPATIRLTVECSTAELSGNRRNRRSRAGLRITKAFAVAKDQLGRSRPIRGRVETRCRARDFPQPAGGGNGKARLRSPPIRWRHGMAVKSSQSGPSLNTARFRRVDSMPVIEAKLKPLPSIVPVDVPDVFDMSDDECLRGWRRSSKPKNLNIEILNVWIRHSWRKWPA